MFPSKSQISLSLPPSLPPTRVIFIKTKLEIFAKVPLPGFHVSARLSHDRHARVARAVEAG